MSQTSPAATLPRGSPTATGYRRDIDGLRAVAVLSVVAFHAFPAWLPGGFVGVDVFFVISGYLISSIILSEAGAGRFSLSGFYARRIRRIFPALLTVLVACLGVGWFALLAGEYAQLGKHVIAGAAFVSNLVLYSESGYFDNAAETKPLLHLWSLAIEEQFYIFWPLLLAAVGSRRSLLLGLILLIGLSSLATGVHLTTTDPTAAFYWPVARFWELMVGGLLAYLTVHPPAPARVPRHTLSLLGAGLLLAGLLLINKGSAFPGYWALLPTFGALFLLAAGPEAVVNRRLLSLAPMVGVGLISYPLYLWHWPLLSFARILESQPLGRDLRAAAVLLALVLATLTYALIERPLRHRARVVGVLLPAMGLVAGMGLALVITQGYGQRLGADIVARSNSGDEEHKVALTACRRFQPRAPRFKDDCLEYAVSATRNVAVFGDSHAIVAAWGIAEFLAPHGIGTYLYSKTACPVQLGLRYGYSEADAAQCLNLAADAVRTVAADPTIQKVFIVSRGPMYLAGSAPGRRARPYEIITGPAFRGSLETTARTLATSGKRVYYVVENPELPASPYACEHRPLRLHAKHCTVTRAETETYQRDYRAVLAGVSGVVVLHTLDAFCATDPCLTTRDGTYLYADADHLSVAGSRYQAQTVLSGALLE